MDADVKELKRDLLQIKDTAVELYNSIGIDKAKAKLTENEKLSMADGFWNDQEMVAKINKENSRLKKKVDPWVALLKDIDDAIELLSIAAEENDEGVVSEVSEIIPKLKSKYEELENIELFSGEDDDKSAFLAVHAGAGGTESQDWANMLFRMYTRWAEKQGFDCEIVDYMSGEEAGIKQATVLVKGDNAYGYLKGEMGIHRLVRISPFDANKRRHTSFASVEIIPEVSEEINVDINETDLRIDTYRASGAGGQHVNRTDSAVRITHLPTGIVVSCQNERSQHKNKAFAMKVLKSKLYELEKQAQKDKMDEKIGQKKDISWGNQIRSYVFQPYTLVKDHRTGEETGSVDFVLDGDLNRFMYAYLKSINIKG